ncbi:MAG: hypothetical protein H7247_15855 [Polaromonas sp.]|nr:hypothetical protein [Gemmatimonadaceae bacterium]
MRHTSPQLPFTAPWISHAHATELAAMSALLDEQPALSAGVQQDLEAGCPTNARTGRPGLTEELAHLECLPATPARERVRGHLTTLLPRVSQVIDQTTRRVLHGGPGAPAGAPSPARGGEWSVPSR